MDCSYYNDKMSDTSHFVVLSQPHILLMNSRKTGAAAGNPQQF